MKLARYGPPGGERPAIVATDGSLRDLSAAIGDITPRELSPESLSSLALVDPMTLPKVPGTPRLGVPFAGSRKFLAIGLNYSDHAAEAGMAIPKEPILFSKAITCLSGPADDVLLPKGSAKTDWEVELGFVVGKTARNVRREDALSHVAGYFVVNDISEREWQLERGSQWDKGKGFDTFGPVGPWLVTADEIPDPQNLPMWLDVNGERMQSGNTRTMIFPVDELLSFLSRWMTLEPGDIVTTGTPPGVGMGKKPVPRYLREGDVMTLSVEGLGEQRLNVKRDCR